LGWIALDVLLLGDSNSLSEELMILPITFASISESFPSYGISIFYSTFVSASFVSFLSCAFTAAESKLSWVFLCLSPLAFLVFFFCFFETDFFSSSCTASSFFSKSSVC